MTTMENDRQFADVNHYIRLTLNDGDKVYEVRIKDALDKMAEIIDRFADESDNKDATFADQLEILKGEILAGNVDTAVEWIDAAVKLLRRPTPEPTKASPEDQAQHDFMMGL